MEHRLRSALIVLVIAAAACSGSDPGSVMRDIDGLEGWTRTGPPGRYTEEGLYGYIDGGAELVLEYGFRELSVFTFEPAASGPAGELTLEIYRMRSGSDAFGLYSSKLEGGEDSAPGIAADNWIGPGQGSLVKGEYMVNVVAPDRSGLEIGAVLKAVDRKLPGRRTERPEGLDRLPSEGLVPSSRRFIRGPVAARNESPFLEGDFWGFGGAAAGTLGSRAYSAKYGSAPSLFKLAVVELAASVETPAVDAGVAAAFGEYLEGVARIGEVLEGRNAAGRWFLYKRTGAAAALVLGAPDRAESLARLERALPPADPSPK